MSQRSRASGKKPAAKPDSRVAGVISLHEFYRIDEAKLRLGWPDAAYRAALRRGLSVLVSGKRRYVTGEEILRFLKADHRARDSGSS